MILEKHEINWLPCFHTQIYRTLITLSDAVNFG
jgi:hypothetical protein